LGGVFAKNTSLETKFPSALDSGNFLSFDWYFSQIPLTNMIYLYIITPYIRMLDSDWLIAVIIFYGKYDFANTMKKVKSDANTPT
jgi:hypothetical protein